jgi:hypothetical protein
MGHSDDLGAMSKRSRFLLQSIKSEYMAASLRKPTLVFTDFFLAKITFRKVKKFW